MNKLYLQSDQPSGVPPLPLTGERTLPDIAEENYWYQRHLVVYKWIAERVAGKSVVDMACGEGYGSSVLADRAAKVVGVEANPEAFEHAKAKYSSEKVSFQRTLVQTYSEPSDAVVFLQTIEHIEDPVECLNHFHSLLPEGGTAYISTPNVLTLAGEGKSHSGNPWHIKEYRADEYRELCSEVFDHVHILGLFHARKLKLHETAIKYGWDTVHKKLGFTDRFYNRFTPAISTDDFRFSPIDLDRALDFVAVCRK